MSRHNRVVVEGVTPIINRIRANFDANNVIYEVCGSVRRGLSVIGDIDIVVSRDIDVVVKYLNDLKPSIITMGKKKAEINVSGLPVDIVHANLNQWGAMVCHTTGSVKFNIMMRKQAQSLGLKLNQYGVFDNTGRCLASKIEEDIFDVLRIKYVKPDRR
jgi:DNA polymerase (family X)